MAPPGRRVVVVSALFLGLVAVLAVIALVAHPEERTEILEEVAENTNPYDIRGGEVPEVPKGQDAYEKQVTDEQTAGAGKASDSLSKVSRDRAQAWSNENLLKNHDGSAVPGSPLNRAKAATAHAVSSASKAVNDRFAAAQAKAKKKKADAAFSEYSAQKKKEQRDAVARQKAWDVEQEAREKAEAAEKKKEELKNFYDKKFADEQARNDKKNKLAGLEKDAQLRAEMKAKGDAKEHTLEEKAKLAKAEHEQAVLKVALKTEKKEAHNAETKERTLEDKEETRKAVKNAEQEAEQDAKDKIKEDKQKVEDQGTGADVAIKEAEKVAEEGTKKAEEEAKTVGTGAAAAIDKAEEVAHEGAKKVEEEAKK